MLPDIPPGIHQPAPATDPLSFTFAQLIETPAPGIFNGPPALGPDKPMLGDIAGAAFRSGNLIGSAITRSQAGVDNTATDPKYSPWNEIKGTPYEPYWSTFVGSNNSGYTASLKRMIDQQQADKQTLATSGWRGTLMGLAAGLLDMTTIVPSIWLLRNVARGNGISAKFIGAAAVFGVGAGMQEVGLHAMTADRSAGETMRHLGMLLLLGCIVFLAGCAFAVWKHWPAFPRQARVFFGGSRYRRAFTSMCLLWWFGAATWAVTAGQETIRSADYGGGLRGLLSELMGLPPLFLLGGLYALRWTRREPARAPDPAP